MAFTGNTGNRNDEFAAYRYAIDTVSLTATTQLTLPAISCNGANCHLMQLNCTNMPSVAAFFVVIMQATIDSIASSNWFSISNQFSISAIGNTGLAPNNASYQNQNYTYEAVRLLVVSANTAGGAFNTYYYGARV